VDDVYIAVVAMMPSASDATATIVTPGEPARLRMP